MKQKILIPLLLIALMLMMFIMNGCGNGKTTETAPTEIPTIENTTATVAPIPTPIIPPTAVTMNGTTRSDEITGSNEIDATEEEITSKLGMLKSYQAELQVTFDGDDPEGQSQNGTMSFLVTRDNATQDTEMIISGSGSLFEKEEQSSEMKFYLIDGASYILVAASAGEEAQCMNVPSDANNVAPDLSDMLGDFDYENATLVEEGVMVNGVATNHYRIDDTEKFQGEGMMVSLDKVEVNAWIAQDGDYIVKMESTMEGKSIPVANEEVSGTVTTNYNVTKINDPVQVTLPSVCEPAP